MELMCRWKIRHIDARNEAMSKTLYDLGLQSNVLGDCAEYVLTGRVLNLDQDEWQLPCVKCNWIYRGWWNFEASFPAFNCAEPLAYALSCEGVGRCIRIWSQSSRQCHSGWITRFIIAGIVDQSEFV